MKKYFLTKFRLTRAGYAMRLEASTLAARRFAYPELGDAAPPGRRPASGEPNEGLPARVGQDREHRSVSAGRSGFAQRLPIYEV